MKIRERIPNIGQIVPVFAMGSLMIYGWTTYRFIQKLPSWLFYLNFKEILSNYSYTLVFDLTETLLFISMVLILNFVLPSRLFMSRFVARGSLLAVFGLGYLIFLALAVGESKLSQFPSDLFKWSPIVFLLIVILAILLPFLDPVKRIAENFADRAIIFLYIFLPLSGLGLLLFLYNNLF